LDYNEAKLAVVELVRSVYVSGLVLLKESVRHNFEAEVVVEVVEVVDMLVVVVETLVVGVVDIVDMVVEVVVDSIVEQVIEENSRL
jgi:hypothetical protein